MRRRASRQGRPQIRPRSRLTGGLDTSEPVLSAILALAQWREPEENDPKTWRSNMRSWSEAGLHGGEESMSDDPDLPKASYVLQVLGQARLSRNETAAKMVEHLVYVAANTGLRPPEIEQAQQAAWIAISELASALDEEGFAGPTIWKAALRATQSWKELLT